MARKIDLPTRVIQAAMDRAAQQGWRQLTMAEIASAARVPLAEMYGRFPSKGAILAEIMHRADAAVLAAGAAPAVEPVRDRLFDVIMRRLDALGPYREGLAAVVRDLPRDPLAALCLQPRFLNGMAWMLEAAGVATGGLSGRARLAGLAMIYADVARVWLHDGSEDLAETMAALDRRLRQAERLVGLCGWLGTAARGRRATAARPAPAED